MHNLYKILKQIFYIFLFFALLHITNNGAALTLAIAMITLLDYISNKWTTTEKVTYFIGLIIMTTSEAVFISSGIESFSDQSLFGLMPFWLPLLWAYSFIIMKRVLALIESSF